MRQFRFFITMGKYTQHTVDRWENNLHLQSAHSEMAQRDSGAVADEIGRLTSILTLAYIFIGESQ